MISSARTAPFRRIFKLTSTSEVVHAGGIVDEIGIEPAAAPRELDAPELRDAQVAALADDLAIQFAGVDAHRVVAAVADVAVALEGWP